MPGLFVKVKDSQTEQDIKSVLGEADPYVVNYVGINLALDGFALESVTGDTAKFAAAVSAVRSVSQKPLILVANDPEVIAAGLQAIDGEKPLIHAANAANWEAMAALAKQHGAPLVVQSE